MLGKTRSDPYKLAFFLICINYCSISIFVKRKIVCILYRINAKKTVLLHIHFKYIHDKFIEHPSAINLAASNEILFSN